MDEFVEWIATRFAGVDWRWELFGLIGEGLFFTRLVVQWTASERARRPVLPVSYWYMSLVGAVMLVFYGVHKGSLVVLLPQFIGVPMYARNLQLELRHRAREAWKQRIGVDGSDFPWPRISFIVPVHNEEKTLAPTLQSLLDQDYPDVEIIAALNGCSDTSGEIAREMGVTVVESEQAGISFGRNLGAAAATGEILFFVDADTTLPPDAARGVALAMHEKECGVVGLPGRPDRGGPVVRWTFWVANRYARLKRVSPPGGGTAVDRATFDAIAGFDESLPQGTNTDFILRAMAAGATYLVAENIVATTSIRRFEKVGIIRQMLDWRRNHQAIRKGERDKVEKKDYDVVR